MKIRSGFVSNSSSSSFIVRVFEDYKKKIITPEQEKLLQKFGFKEVNCCFADQVVCDLTHDLKPELKRRQNNAMKKFSKITKKLKQLGKIPNRKPKLFYNYGYDVTCNQAEPMYFLLKNNIPFEASIHYNHSNIIYAKDAKYFLEIQNYGEQSVMSGEIDKNYKRVMARFEQCKNEPMQKIPVKKWLKEEEKWQKEWEEQEKESIQNALEENKD